MSHQIKSKTRRKKLLRVAILPTLLTLGNLLFGFLAINHIFHDKFFHAAIFIGIAMIFDALDGKIAKLTKSASNFGAQLDSLSDLVTFGVAPALLVYSIINKNGAVGAHLFPDRFTLALSSFYVICAALRLARFNIETTLDQIQHEYFAGLPTPAAAGLLCAAVLLSYDLEHTAPLIITVLPFMLLLISILMLTRLPYTHILNKLARTTRQPFPILLIILLLVLFSAFRPIITLCVIFSLYTLSGPFLYIKSRVLRRSTVPTTDQHFDPIARKTDTTKPVPPSQNDTKF
ncbi:MAG: CDP-diacylglycerol--serine O-phosphatidyltransferase [Planctomycetes bacterium]|nr:CDP-diacylglycerol--serine O-phosphatidyltransferase [Planctomycetota bacterium]